MSDLSGFRHSAQTLAALLEEENNCLLAGEYAPLRDIAERKMALVAEVERHVAEHQPGHDNAELAADMRLLKRLTEHNGALLKAAYNGSLSAQNRINAIASQRAEVGAYGMNGKTLVSSEAVTSREKTL